MATQYTIDQIADYIISFAHESGSFISNLKLQKLLYYTQAWHLALKDEPLFDAKFEAWIHGPVNPETYQRFKDFGYKNIDTEVSAPNIDAITNKFLQEVLEEYFLLDAYTLERLTHQETPWLKARGSHSISESCKEVISETEMRDYYKSRAGA